ncbi:MAG: fibronectin type III domain-containing protein [Owenweeksia sp.]|nr:fibronectin type III domain-containing protein [Owenweeksia sp.]
MGVQNFGTNRIDSVLVNWEVNGISQSPVWYNNQLDTIGGSGQNLDVINLGNYSFSANTTYNFKYWTSMPNSTADSENINDTLHSTISLGAPTGLSVFSVTDTTAQVGWNILGGSNFELIYGPAGFDPAVSGNTMNSSSSPTLLDSLNPGTDYELYIVADCGSGNYSDTSDPAAFRTLCFNPPPVVLPYYENFNGANGTYVGDKLPAYCSPVAQWHFETNLQNSGRLEFSSYSNSTGSNSKGASMDAIGGYTENNLIATLDMSAYDTSTSSFITLSFSHLSHGDDAGVNDRVWIRGDTAESWINIYNLAANSSSGRWTQALNLDLTAALRNNNQNFGPSFQLRFGQDGRNQIIYLSGTHGRTFDNIELEEKNCLETQSINLYFTDTSQVGFSVGDSSTGFDYQWGPCGFIQGTATFISNQTGADTIQGLYPNTCYELYIRQNCDTNGVSGWTGPFSFNTKCAAVSANYNQNFDGATAQAPFGGVECWAISGPGANNIELADNLSISANPVSMPNAVVLNPGNINNGDTAALISPWLANMATADKRIEFEAAFADINSQLLVGLLNDRDDLSSLQILDSISSSTTGSFIDYTLNLNDTSRVSNAKHVVFLHGPGNGAIYLDDFVYTFSPSCLPPLQNSMGVYKPSTNSTLLYWGAGSEGKKTYVELGSVGFVPGSATFIRKDSVPKTRIRLPFMGSLLRTVMNFTYKTAAQQTV